MILRDPVHGLVAFEDDDEVVIEALLATREVQRLRRVRQLGLTSMVFPGAEHSRFAHALGAAYVMVRLHQRIRAVESDLPQHLRLDREARRDSLAAALLHDLGHGPFSHLFEEVMPGARHHEEWSFDAIADSSTEVHQALESLDPGMAARVANLLRGDYRIPYLARAVSGTLDVDRADYLLRDSHMTGVRYGLYDLDWLLRALRFAEVDGEWVLAIEGRKGLPPIEGFFLGRHFMYQQVYHHKATRAAESSIRMILARVAERVREGATPEHTPPAIVSAARGEDVSLGGYLDLDDVQLLGAIARWERGDDALLAGLCGDLQRRRLPKTLPLPPDREEVWTVALERAVDVASRLGARADLVVHLDVPGDVPFPEEAGAGGPDKRMHVCIRHRPIQPLGDVSFLLHELRGKRIRRPRLIFPASLRAPIASAVNDLLDSEQD